MKMWSGRFATPLDQLTEQYNNLITFDLKLLPYDVIGSIAHVKGLVKAEVLTENEGEIIITELKVISEKYAQGAIEVDKNDEDVHMLIKRLLTLKLGELGKKVHTGRSRNDQVACATKLYVKEQIEKISEELTAFITILEQLKVKHVTHIMPGVTHLQAAQPITLGYFFATYIEMFKRDLSRLEDCGIRLDVSPLGSGALAGTSYAIEGHYTSQLLGFKEPGINAMYGVSDRDYIVETLFVISVIGVYISKLAEEVIVFNSSIYNYLTLDDSFATGSSIMPKRKTLILQN